MSAPTRWLGIVVPLAVAVLSCTVAADCADTALRNEQPVASVLNDLLSINQTTQWQLNVPPRYMWGWGPGYAGYCGSFSLQSAGLYFGLWVSAEYVRYAANTSEVLLGMGHYAKAAEVFGIDVDVFDNAGPKPTISRYLDWVAGHTRAMNPVIGGVYERKQGGDDDYDHIVPLIGAQRPSAANGALPVDPVTGRRSNVTTVWYNDLYLDQHRQLSGSLLGVNRSDFTARSWSQPYDYALPYGTNYGLAVRGLQDPLLETLRLKLSAWSWTEPDWGAEDRCQEQSAANPKPGPIDMSATVYGLTPGNTYAILRFDGNETASTVDRNFLASEQWTRRWDFVAVADTHVINLFDRVMTNTVVTYRAVVAVRNAPRAPAPADDGHNGGLVTSRIPLALLVFAAVGGLIAGVWYMSKRYWDRKNPLYDPSSIAAPVRARDRTASQIERHPDEEAAALTEFNRSNSEALHERLTDDGDSA